jgi:hypothetical protein
MQKEERELVERLEFLSLERQGLERRLKAIRGRKLIERTLIKDRDGNTIRIGDKVSFLTKGKYTSTEGIVTRVNKSRVTTKDSRGNYISRAPHNVRKV